MKWQNCNRWHGLRRGHRLQPCIEYIYLLVPSKKTTWHKQHSCPFSTRGYSTRSMPASVTAIIYMQHFTTRDRMCTTVKLCRLQPLRDKKPCGINYQQPKDLVKLLLGEMKLLVVRQGNGDYRMITHRYVCTIWNRPAYSPYDPRSKLLNIFRNTRCQTCLQQSAKKSLQTCDQGENSNQGSQDCCDESFSPPKNDFLQMWLQRVKQLHG